MQFWVDGLPCCTLLDTAQCARLAHAGHSDSPVHCNLNHGSQTVRLRVKVQALRLRVSSGGLLTARWWSTVSPCLSPRPEDGSLFWLPAKPGVCQHLWYMCDTPLFIRFAGQRPTSRLARRAVVVWPAVVRACQPCRVTCRNGSAAEHDAVWLDRLHGF